MKRSEINKIINVAKEFLSYQKFYLPVWAHWSLNDWKKNQESAKTIIDNSLGWDITDFGSCDFYRRGLFLFTIRNGNIKKGKKSYAEKIMIVEENQETPLHFHKNKIEDIINRGGGNLIIELFNLPNRTLKSETYISVKIDEIERKVISGEKIRLLPGESICLEQNMLHRFYGEFGKGKILVGEVSSVNDDLTDNYFQERIERFPEIEEDENPVHLLVSDYSKFLNLV